MNNPSSNLLKIRVANNRANRSINKSPRIAIGKREVEVPGAQDFDRPALHVENLASKILVDNIGAKDEGDGVEEALIVGRILFLADESCFLKGLLTSEIAVGELHADVEIENGGCDVFYAEVGIADDGADFGCAVEESPGGLRSAIRKSDLGDTVANDGDGVVIGIEELAAEIRILDVWAECEHDSVEGAGGAGWRLCLGELILFE